MFDCKRRIAVPVTVSFLLHILALQLYFWLSPELDHVGPSDRAFQVVIKTQELQNEEQAKPTENTQNAKEVEPDSEKRRQKDKPKDIEKSQQKDKPKDIAKDNPEVLPKSYSSKDKVSSGNQVDKDVGNLKHGDRAITKRRKQNQAVEKVVDGALTTSEIADTQAKASDQASDDDLEDALSSVYGDFEGYDDEQVDSEGESDEGIESNVRVKAYEGELVRNAVEVGNTKLLMDHELSEAFVEDPFSDAQSNEVTTINRYLQAIHQKVLGGWNNPLSDGHIKQQPYVEIIFELNSEGYIRNPKVRVQSIFPELDASLISHLKSLRNHKFEMHKSYIDKYRFIRIRWAGSGVDYEAMPFEIDQHTDE